MLLGYKTRLYRKIVEENSLEKIDVFMFGEGISLLAMTKYSSYSSHA